MNYIIIEDENHNAALLQSSIEKYDKTAHLLAILPTVQESITWFNENSQPDVIFMDVRLADGLSFEIFKHVHIQSPVVFTTAYDEYALQAFKVYGAAYLLKPIVQEELEETLEKIKQIKSQFTTDDLDTLLEMLQTKQKKYKSRFLLHFREGYKIILIEEIDYVVLESKTVYFKLVDGLSFATPYTLEELEEQLDPQYFFRVNRQYILSISSIDQIIKYINEKSKIILKRNSKAEIIVSRIRMPQFKLWLNK